MSSGYLFAVVLLVVVVIALFALLRGRRIREKYVGLWLGVAIAVIVLGAFPALTFWLARVVGVQTPVNLLFSGALAVLLIVCIQLSVAISALEERNRTVVEEIALLRQEVSELRSVPAPPPSSSTRPPEVAPPLVDSRSTPDRPAASGPDATKEDGS